MLHNGDFDVILGNKVRHGSELPDFGDWYGVEVELAVEEENRWAGVENDSRPEGFFH